MHCSEFSVSSTLALLVGIGCRGKMASFTSTINVLVSATLARQWVVRVVLKIHCDSGD